MADPQATAEQLRVIFVVYASSLIPLAIVFWLRAAGRLPRMIWRLYWLSFATCALGWELWFTYGWVGGDPVDERRAAVLNGAIPIHVNWLLNSLADAGAICLGGLVLVWMIYRPKDAGHAVDIMTPHEAPFFRSWHWGVFAILLAHFIAQNLVVEMFLYHDQLSEGKPLSWAPLVPTGPWFNPTLFRFGDRTITLQGQVSWLIMTPLFYAAVLWTGRRDAEDRAKATA